MGSSTPFLPLYYDTLGMQRITLRVIFIAIFFFPSPSFSEPASLEEIRLLRQELRDDIKTFRDEMRGLNDQTNKRIDDLRETTLWILKMVIGIAVAVFGFLIGNYLMLRDTVRKIEYRVGKRERTQVGHPEMMYFPEDKIEMMYFLKDEMYFLKDEIKKLAVRIEKLEALMQKPASGGESQ